MPLWQRGFSCMRQRGSAAYDPERGSFMEMNPMIWLGLLAVLLIAAIAAWMGAGVLAQIVLFLAVSGVLLVFTRPLAVKYLNKDKVATNANSLIGKKAVVTIDIDNLAQTGQVLINDVEWTARTSDDSQKISKGAVVEIKEIRGVKLIVEKKKEA